MRDFKSRVITAAAAQGLAAAVFWRIGKSGPKRVRLTAPPTLPGHALGHRRRFAVERCQHCKHPSWNGPCVRTNGTEKRNKETLGKLYVDAIITFRVSRRRRKLDCGHARLCVCLSAVACLHYCTDPDITWGSGRDAASRALLGRFAIGARAALLWQHNANPSYKCERETLASTLVSPAMGHWGTCLPSTSNNFLVNFRAAQSLTATLCGCLSKHVCILPQQLR